MSTLAVPSRGIETSEQVLIGTSMQLDFNTSHLSITTFPSVQIPDFTVITGPNGAGKTHLLQALANGSIRTDIAQLQNPGQDIRFFNWSTLVPTDQGGMSSEALRQERQNLEAQFVGIRQHPSVVEPLRGVARAFGLPQKFIDDPFSMVLWSKEDWERELSDPEQAEAAMLQISGTAANGSQFIINNTDPVTQATLHALSGKYQVPVVAITPKQVSVSGFSNWGRTDLFQQSFARLFLAYRDAELSNRLAEFNYEKGYSEEPFLAPGEFREQYGPAPWKFVNDTIAAAGLDFVINAPASNDFLPYTPQLTKISTGAIIPFSSLSSGEKVLMSFAFCVYYANDRRQLTVYPKLILFDEIDAPLHPSMTRSLLDTITSTLVKEFGIKVIATTHSPSTVALAPEGAVHLMLPGRPGLHTASKAEALNILTVGVPTIAISFDGRRQVFVESPSDAKTYDSLYKILKPELRSERSLEFVATGTRSAKGHEANTGCDVLKRLVGELAAAGNNSVFGLVDYDGHHTATGRIAVLGSGGRNGIENYVLDPLSLALLICREFAAERAYIGVAETTPYPAILQLGADELQKIVEFVGLRVFASEPLTKIRSQYRGGLSLEIDARWADTDDHALEGLVVTAFPFLQAVTKQQAGKLLERIIMTVMADEPSLIHVDLESTFRDLLERPAH